MKINWKLRLKNKVTLLALITCGATFAYQVLGILDITVPISQDTVIQFAGVGLNILAALGVIVDPTTKGIVDSDRVITYEEPR